MSAAPPALTCLPVTGVGEVVEGEDLAATLLAAATAAGLDLRDGDVLAVTSKVLSKAEGRQVAGDRDAALPGETARVVARRGGTVIVRTHHGLVMAAAGIDASNTEPGTVLLLPRDPDASARRLREQVAARAGVNVAVVVTDTAGRAWRHGQTDLAVGAAGLDPLEDLAGTDDGYGNRLAVTAPAVADEVAAAADLVTGKLSRCPAAVVRGLAGRVLSLGEHGPGAAVLVREEEQDLFGLGAREAVLAALAADPAQRSGYGAVAGPAEVVDALARIGLDAEDAPDAVRDGAAGSGAPVVRVRLPGSGPQSARAVGAAEARLAAAAYALGWRVDHPTDGPVDGPGATRLLRPAAETP